MRSDLPEISEGSFTLLIIRQFVSVAGSSARSNINYLQLQPEFSVNLPASWFIKTAPENELQHLHQ